MNQVLVLAHKIHQPHQEKSPSAPFIDKKLTMKFRGIAKYLWL